MPPRPPAAADSGSSGVTPGGPAHARPGPQHSRGPAQRGAGGEGGLWGPRPACSVGSAGTAVDLSSGVEEPPEAGLQMGVRASLLGNRQIHGRARSKCSARRPPLSGAPGGPLRRGDLDDHWSVGRPRDTGESRVLCERSLGPQPRDAAGGPGSQTRRGPHRRRPCVSPARGPGGWLCALPSDVTREVHTPCIDRGRVCAVCRTGSLGRAS